MVTDKGTLYRCAAAQFAALVDVTVGLPVVMIIALVHKDSYLCRYSEWPHPHLWIIEAGK